MKTLALVSRFRGKLAISWEKATETFEKKLNFLIIGIISLTIIILLIEIASMAVLVLASVFSIPIWLCLIAALILIVTAFILSRILI